MRKWRIAPLALAVSLFTSTAAHAIIIELNFSAQGVDEQTAAMALAGFQQAAKIWEKQFSDPATIRLNVGFAPLDPGVLGQTDSTGVTIPYSVVRSALEADRTTKADNKAVANLPTGNSISFFTNSLGTAAEGSTAVFDPGSSIFGGPTGDNEYLFVNTANAKALGFGIAPEVVDGEIIFSSNFNFDFDRSNGIDADAFDFVGVAAHEIGHALGFVSGVDIVDILTGFGPAADIIRGQIDAALANPANHPILRAIFDIPDDVPLTPDAFADANMLDLFAVFFGASGPDLALFNTLDLFRYSDLSFDEEGNFIGFDFTTGLGLDRPLTFDDFLIEFGSDIPYFSIDGGLTAIAPFAMGNFNGGFEFQFPDNSIIDLPGNQASHWFEVFGVRPPFGILDPTGARGELLNISDFDLLAFDAIGYDPIPEPQTLALMGLGLMGLGIGMGRRRKS